MTESPDVETTYSGRKKFTRRKDFELYKKVIELRKSEFSYREIRRETGLAKSTINNWLTYAGLTLSKAHLKIQARKRSENHFVATAASKITRKRRSILDVNKSVQMLRPFFNDSFFVTGVILYEAEGSKSTDCRFSNSDYRLVITFVKFIEKYFHVHRDNNIRFSLYIHISRQKDLEKIKSFWSKKLKCPSTRFYIYWKKNIVTYRKDNPDYVGQISVRVMGVSILGRKLLAISDIILRQHYRS